MLNLRLETAGGDAYVTAESIVWVSSAFQKGNYPPTRSVGLSSGHTIYVLNSQGNIDALRASGIGDMIPATTEAVVVSAKPRGRPKRAAAPVP